MRRFAGKLAFVHRTLWERDHAYRWAALLGPPPVVGIAAAALVMVALGSTDTRDQDTNAPWAQWNRNLDQERQPFTEATAPLPQKTADGHFIGFEPGWHGVVQPLSIDATLTTTISSEIQGSFTVNEPVIPLSRFVDAAPPTGLFVGAVSTWFVVQTPGLYAFSAELARSGTLSANCLLWLETPKHRMFRHLTVNTTGPAVLKHGTTEFTLKPGLLKLILAAGCWRGDRMVGAGDVTLMVRRPGQTALQAATADELIRPIRK